MKNGSQTRPGIVLAVACTAAFVASLDVFIVNVAFDAIGRSFSRASESQVSWVLTAYAIVFAALLVPAGRLADRYGHKGTFVAGFAVFTLASAACAASPGLWWLVGARAVQAVGAALLTPASLGLVVAFAPAGQRARMVRTWAASGAVAAALGPVVGGVLVQVDWRWVFLVNVPVGVAAVIAALTLVPSPVRATETRLPDLVGAGLLTVSIAALTLGLVQGPTWGWAALRTDTAWVLAVAAGAGFLISSARHPRPLVEPALLRVRAFAWANATALLFSVAFAASLLVGVLWMQQVWHYCPVRTGLAIAPGPLMVPLFTGVAHRLAARVPVGRVVAAGCALFAAGALLTSARVGPTPHYASQLLPGWLLAGVGVGLALPSILSSATADLPAERGATGSAVVSMSRQVGTALGVSLLVAVIGSPVGYPAVHDAFRHGWWALAAADIAAAFTALGMTPQRRAPDTTANVEGTPGKHVSAPSTRRRQRRRPSSDDWTTRNRGVSTGQDTQTEPQHDGSDQVWCGGRSTVLCTRPSERRRGGPWKRGCDRLTPSSRSPFAGTSPSRSSQMSVSGSPASRSPSDSPVPG